MPDTVRLRCRCGESFVLIAELLTHRAKCSTTLRSAPPAERTHGAPATLPAGVPLPIEEPAA
jgi:hypothetical protein